ncbi:MAG: peptidase [Bacteroidetes bacterium]|nr:peptidase [Bacteroidota bacterium]
MKRILFVFLDGVGIGGPSSHNAFETLDLPGWSALAGNQKWTSPGFKPISEPNRIVRQIDATLGIEGLPQSGTGQSSLFTGVNCATLAGRHYGPYPHSSARSVLRTQNMFVQCKELPGLLPPAFLNAFPKRFFEAAKKRDRWSTTTRCCLDAEIPLKTLHDLENGRAVAADLDGKGLSLVAGAPVTTIDIDTVSQRMASLCHKQSLSLFEYFLTDKAGHSDNPVEVKNVLGKLDELFTGLLKHLDFNQTTLVVTSDHGNIEDLSTKSHTLNPVPLIALGSLAPYFKDITDLTGVTPAIISALKSTPAS